MAVAKASRIDRCHEAIRREFTEQPGLRLTRPQAVRLSGVPRDQCHRALDVLVEEGFLMVTSDGQYCRPRLDVDVDDGLE
jgi:DNA-binding IclR family transcriptional regulator